MVLQSTSNIPPLLSSSPCAAPSALLPLRRRTRESVGRNARWSLTQARACIGGGNPAHGFTAAAGRGAKSIILKRFSDEDDLSYASGAGYDTDGDRSFYSSNFGQDPIVDKLRNQLGVIHPIPSPPINRNVFALFAFFFFFGVIFDKVLAFGKRGARSGGGKLESSPQVPSGLSLFFDKDLQRKESVEWVNMVLGKLWKVYRNGIENWIVGLLQPVIDNLQKPDYVQRVEIKQFSLGDEPLSVRSVERRTSRRMNDLQYQIGLRYSGGARMLLLLSLKFSKLPILVPVGVRNFDIDGELWVKLRLIPTEPWVGAVSWAFVSLPKIKFELSLFRLFNLMAIPVLSMFLTKLLTEDLPKLFVRPKKIVLDFQKGEAVGPVPNNSESGEMQKEKTDIPIQNSSKSGEIQEGNNDYAGELSVTLLDARKLSYIFYGKTDPYVILKLGDQIIRSKRNSQTTVIGPPGKPIWNQDFHMFVADPKNEKLCIEVKDSLGFADLSVGTAEVDLGSLKDTVPADRIVALRGGWSLFGNRSVGEILLRLTYKAYVEDEDDDQSEKTDTDTEASEDEFSDSELNTTSPKRRWKAIESDKESFMNVLAALLISEEFQGIVTSERTETANGKSAKTGTATQTSETNAGTVGPGQQISPSETSNAQGSTLLWLAFVTSVVVITAMSIGGSSMFNP